MRKPFTILFTLFISLTCFSQISDGKKHGINDPETWSKTVAADKLYKEKSYYNAILSYQELVKKEPQNKYLNNQLAMCYYRSRDYQNAVRTFAICTDLEEPKKPSYPYSWFYYGESLRSIADYEKAKIAYIKFYKQKVKTVDFKQYVKFAKQASRSCDYALLEIKKDTNFIKTNHLEDDINHAYSDFSPVYHDKTLYFSTLRYDTILSYSKPNDGFYPVELYSTDSTSTSWNNPSQLGYFNSEDAHTANLTFSKKGDLAFFTKCWNDPHNHIYCHILSSKKQEDNTWSKPHNLHHKVNTHSYTNTQPSYAEISVRKKRTYIQLNVLYFVSDRPGGFGGLDIWYSIMDENGKPSRPINCGKRINSARDEVSPFYDSEEGKLYFSSRYHKGFGGYDVFSSKGKLNKWLPPTNVGLPINSSYDDTYFNQIHTDTLENGFFVSNRPGGIALANETCCDDIYYFEEYKPQYKKLELELFSQIVRTDTITSTDTIRQDSLGVEIVKLEERKTIVENIDSFPIIGAKIGVIRKNKIDEAKRLGKNTEFGLRQSIKWIDTTSIHNPVQLNLLENKEYYIIVVKDSMETILEPINFSKISSISYNMNKTIYEEVKTQDTLNTEITGTLASAVQNDSIQEDQVFLLENMYFDTNKDEIKEISLPSLELLVHFLEEKPKIKIEIAGHTDSQGDDAYNLDLSQRRAESVKEYLIKHGVNKRRLEAKGYGETLPIASNENAEGRKFNRRTEIKILSN